MSLIFIISIATCTSSIFVHLEKYALRNPTWQVRPRRLGNILSYRRAVASGCIGRMKTAAMVSLKGLMPA